nr:uncharacterized protein LOC127327459 [Lolium perenne]
MRTMKILALDVGENLDTVVDFLKCFPCLQKLYVILPLYQLFGCHQSHQGNDMNNVRKYDPANPIECFELHLKKVVLKNYDADKKACIDFANFFILNAKVLKEMEIGILKEQTDQWMYYHGTKLQVENRASRDARVKLGRDRYAIPGNHGHTHDLSLADPFEKSLCGHNKSVRYSIL